MLACAVNASCMALVDAGIQVISSFSSPYHITLNENRLGVWSQHFACLSGNQFYWILMHTRKKSTRQTLPLQFATKYANFFSAEFFRHYCVA